MASIFTYDPDPPRVASPWSTPRAATPGAGAGTVKLVEGQAASAPSELLNEPMPDRLEAEPQDGPTEYKLHLLLRPRRSFSSMTTGSRVSGSTHSRPGSTSSRSASESLLVKTVLHPAASNQTKQHRLEQLTTQLLWRLQQSSPYHASSSSNVILPELPDATSDLPLPTHLARVLPGLEESKGALYEIGVTDDGTFVGLAEDEMEESLNNLRAMAASLGCSVEVLRMVPVGECEWVEDGLSVAPRARRRRSSKLWVAEAYVRPNLGSVNASAMDSTPGVVAAHSGFATNRASSVGSPTVLSYETAEQLRVTLSGPTNSGKSSLLGTLSTGTLDNGRGKSRLSLLKHRHEIVSGITSSVTQELLGYRGRSNQIQVVNFASPDVSSWNDIHSSADLRRLVLLSDSAGHPRYRRTAVRGLVGWSPHWTLLCIAADGSIDKNAHGDMTSGNGIPSVDEADLARTHLELCLKLEVPLIVLITKFDMATKSGLRQTLNQVLTSIKTTGRKPLLLPDSSAGKNMMTISPDELLLNTGDNLAAMLADDPHGTIPIILTSAVKGSGIARLHALLSALPLPDEHSLTLTPSLRRLREAGTVFHVEDIYNITPATNERRFDSATQDGPHSTILSGILKAGQIAVGDEMLLGPFPTAGYDDDSDSSSSSKPFARPSATVTSKSFPGALHKSMLQSRYQGSREEWRRVKVVSMRNLRLPIRTLLCGQVGTIGVAPVSEASDTIRRIRKGMVMANEPLKACSSLAAAFRDTDVESLTVGSSVILYSNSVRAPARILSISASRGKGNTKSTKAKDRADDDGFGFSLEDDSTTDSDSLSDQSEPGEDSVTITLHFVATREYVRKDAQVLIMHSGGQGMDGVVGVVQDVYT